MLGLISYAQSVFRQTPRAVFPQDSAGPTKRPREHYCLGIGPTDVRGGLCVEGGDAGGGKVYGRCW